MGAYVYILKDKTGKYYVGSTKDLKRRLKQHGYGHTKTTSRMDEPNLVLCQEYPTLASARSVERKLKRLKRKDYIAKMVEDGFILIRP